MLQAERLDFILKTAREDNFVTVEKLARQLQVSLMTVRRDLNLLCEQRMLERCHGGARLPQNMIMEQDYRVKRETGMEAKRRIAKKAVELIREGDILYLDSGTTVEELARMICERSLRISVVTGDLRVGMALSGSDAEVTMLGGTLYKRTGSVVGYSAAEALRQFRFSGAFLGASTINYEFDAFSASPEKAYIKRTAIQLSACSYLLADGEKFYGQAMCRIEHLNRFGGVITDRQFSDKEKEQLRESGITMIQA